jgi:hypothetical protein
MSRSSTVLSLVVILLDSGAEDDGSVMFEDESLDAQPPAYGFASPRTAVALLNSGCHAQSWTSCFAMLRGCTRLTDITRLHHPFSSTLR